MGQKGRGEERRAPEGTVSTPPVGPTYVAFTPLLKLSNKFVATPSLCDVLLTSIHAASDDVLTQKMGRLGGGIVKRKILRCRPFVGVVT